MAQMTTAPVTLELFNDVSCPWSHGALEPTRRILDEFAADPTVPPMHLHWRFMRLRDMPRAGGLPIAEFQASIAGSDDPERVAEIAHAPHDYVATVGARIDSSRYTWLHDPHTAHCVLAAVRDDAGADRLPSPWSMLRVIYAANFAQGIDVSDLAALRGAIERGGLALPGTLWSALADGAFDDAPRVDRERALEVELDGVPRIVVNGTIVPTWLDIDEVRSSLRAAIGATPAG
ncbi:MAG: hypothetical protein JWM86_1750 [Thermoleophilia bacterium]|nr:hypothetical protein [Thermoleophilia bacterium]